MNTTAEDLYEVLGVAKDASDKDIQRAYRALAKELHPDMNDDKEKKERFKVVTAAYDVLKDPQKRRAYDESRLYGHEPGYHDAGSSIFDFFDLFQESYTRRTLDVEASVSLSFEEAARGTVIELDLSLQRTCGTCKGEGGTIPVPCTTCNGRGLITSRQGLSVSQGICPRCLGHKVAPSEPCTSCRGARTVSSPTHISAKLPPGLADGNVIRLRGKGHSDTRQTGDLYLHLEVRSHRFFKREGNDLLLYVPVTFAEAVLGSEIEVPTLEGSVKLKVPPHSKNGRVLRVKNKGILDGDLLVKLEVAVPQKLSDKERKILEELRTLGENPRSF